MFFFCCLGGGPGPAQTAKKNTRPRPNSKKKTRPRPFRACFFCCLGGWVCLFFCCLGGWVCLFFCCLGGGRVLFFAVWAGACSFFCCLGRGRVLFFAVWAGGVFFCLLFGRGTGVHSLTRLPGSSSSDPTTKETEQPKKKHGFRRATHPPQPRPLEAPNQRQSKHKPLEFEQCRIYSVLRTPQPLNNPQSSLGIPS